MNKITIQTIIDYLMRVVPKGPQEEEELARLIDYLKRRAGA